MDAVRGASRDVDDREGGDEGGGDGGDAAAAARDANARGAVTCSIERASDEEDGEEFVWRVGERAFAVRWRRDDLGTRRRRRRRRRRDGHGGARAMTERLLEVARGAVDEGLGKDGASVRMVEWLETMHDVFTAPDARRGAGAGRRRVERRRVDSESTPGRAGELNSSAKARAVSCLDKYNKFYRNVVTSSRHAEC